MAWRKRKQKHVQFYHRPPSIECPEAGAFPLAGRLQDGLRRLRNPKHPLQVGVSWEEHRCTLLYSNPLYKGLVAEAHPLYKGLVAEAHPRCKGLVRSTHI